MSAAPQAQDEDIDLFALLNALLRHSFRVVLAGVLVFGATLAYGVSKPRTYTSDMAFVPQSGRPSSGVSAIASQLGIASLGGGDAGNSQAFYVDLVKSREILGRVAKHEYAFRDSDGREQRGKLAALLAIRAPTPARTEAAVVKHLRDVVTVSASIKSGVITVQARTAYPELSAQIVRQLFTEINAFNLTGRQLRASAERKFAEQARSEAQAALARAEDRLEGFLEGNRSTVAPGLALQLERLRREVATRQQVYGSLAQMYEQARLEEVRDTPAITVVETPLVPVQPDARGALSGAIKASLFTVTLAVMWVLTLEFFRRGDEGGSPSRAEFIQMVRGFRHRLRHPFSRAAHDPAR